jgi:hypothetical protein
MRAFKKFIQCSIAFKGVLDDGVGGSGTFKWLVKSLESQIVAEFFCITQLLQSLKLWKLNIVKDMV